MRIRVTLLTGALLLASTLAMAQQTPQTPSQPGQTTDAVARPQQGDFDFGFRVGSLDGDFARFSRYQDVREGQAGINFKWSREGEAWFTRLTASNVGYRDQSFTGQFANSRLKGRVEWNQTPLFYGNADLIQTPYSTASIANHVATLTLDQATRDRIQAGTTYTTDAKNGGIINGATQSANAIGIVSAYSLASGGTVWRNLLNGSDLRSRRDDLKADVVFAASRDVDVRVAVNSYTRNGSQPWGASFSFNDAVELPLPIDNRTTDLKAEAEWATQKGMLKVGYDGSFFDNNVTTLVWSNPARATDSWNQSSYSNGLLGGAAMGRMALAPNNHANTVNAAGLYKLPAHSSFNASLAVSSLKQNDELIPFTINSTLQPGTRVTTWASGVPTSWTMQPLDRPTAEANVLLTVANANFTTRPNKYVGLTAKYRYSNWDNRTPIFENQYNVRFDGAPENVPGSETEPGNIKYQTFDGDATFTPVPVFAFRVGFGREGRDLTYRSNLGYDENTFRVAVDTIGNQFVTLRAKYEMFRRTGKNNGTLLTRAGEEEDWADAVGAQPTSAQFDVASRDRDRATLIFDVSPISQVGLSFSVFQGTDKYPGIDFGLLNNKNTGITFGVDLMPSNLATVSFYYGYEKYDSLQASRTANPAPDPSWTDPARNWNLNNVERVDNYGFNVGLNKAIPKTEIRFGVDYSKSDQAFNYGGPRIATIAATIDKTTGLPTFIPLPNIGNKIVAGSIDLKYFFSPKIAVGLNFLHQKYDVSDWSTSGTPGLTNTFDPVGGLILGYGFRPYTANVGGVRVIYLF